MSGMVEGKPLKKRSGDSKRPHHGITAGQKNVPETAPRKKHKAPPRKPLSASILTPGDNQSCPVILIKGAIHAEKLMLKGTLDEIGWITPGVERDSDKEPEKNYKKSHRQLAIFSRDNRAKYTFWVNGIKTTLKASFHPKEINQLIMDLTKQVANVVRNCEVLGKKYYHIQLAVFNVANGTGYVHGGHVPRHSDDEKEHTHDLIASTSFGGSAVFHIEVAGNDGKKLDYPVRLDDGDLVLFNRHLKHWVDPPEDRKYRLNLTFRQFKLPWFRHPNDWE